MAAAPQRASVQVPATSANLGPGFDCLGLALDIYLRVTCTLGGAGLRIAAEPSISTGSDNLIYQAMLAVYRAADSPPAIHLALGVGNDIPLSRGLGSSSAAIIAGLLLANALLGTPFDRDRLLQIGLPLEGHPDNIAPALFGGLVVSAVVDGRPVLQRVPLARAPGVALFIPDQPMSTADARRVLPDTVPRADAVFNTGRSSLLVAALANGNFALLRAAMEDRLHQPFRAAIFPALPALIDAALAAGASGAALSGAGSTVIALCDGEASGVASALGTAAEGLGVHGRSATAHVDHSGAAVLSS
ncbi:MAG: homoserine kinase [Chloroflexi bacterium]|nr:homoserine kinase [Chloroflexota bacterium]